MEYIVNGGDMKIARQPGELIATAPLGSCVAISAFDPVASVGGILNVMLPNYRVVPEQGRKNPLIFVDLGTPAFFNSLFAAGAKKKHLIVKLAGGSSFGSSSTGDIFDMGHKNLIMIRKIFQKNKIKVSGEAVGGTTSRTLFLEVGTGRTWLNSEKREWEL